MLKSYFKTAWRTLVKDLRFTLLNLTGLSTGLACALLIYLWVNDELSFDRFHEKNSQLFQVMEHQHHEGEIMTTDGSAGLLAEALSAEMPEVEYAVAVTPTSWFPGFIVSATKNEKIKATGQFAGKDYFNIFSYGLISGNKDQVLTGKNNIVISESLAHRLFHTTENVLGKAMAWQLEDEIRQVTVAGIFRDVPHNSSTRFDFILPFEAYKEMNPAFGNWGNYGCKTFLVLEKDTDIGEFNRKIAHYIDEKNGGNAYRTLFVRPYADGYLYGRYENGKLAGGRITYVRLFALIAVFVLAIACVNFMNLSTAKATTRLKEVGIRKAIGSSRCALVFRYMGESVMMSFLALVIAVMLILLFLPRFNVITQKQLTVWPGLEVIPWFLGITLVTGIIAGGYPALFLSGFNPVAILKGKIRASFGEMWVRKGLVIFQFTISIVLIMAVWIVYKQIAFVQSKNVGFNRDNVVYFQKEGAITDNLEAFLAEVRDIPGVMNASSMEDIIVGTHSTTVGLDWSGKSAGELIMFENVTVNYDLIETLGISMKEGRAFSKNFGADSNAIIFNEAAVKVMQLKDPVGQTVKLWGQDRTIIGVTRNFNFLSLHEKVKPLFLKLSPKGTTNVMVKIAAGMQGPALEKIGRLYHRFNPAFSFDYKFLDEDYQAQYIAERRVAALSKYFAGLAILISCLGLFGLVAFTSEKRRKEIGIRKVLGASVQNLVVLFSADFMKPVMVAMIIACPIAWVLMHNWLAGFAYRVQIAWWMFALTGLLVLMIALLTVSFQSIRTALVNPVQSLRSE